MHEGWGGFHPSPYSVLMYGLLSGVLLMAWFILLALVLFAERLCWPDPGVGLPPLRQRHRRRACACSCRRRGTTRARARPAPAGAARLFLELDPNPSPNEVSCLLLL